jgi:hypothetical protein
MEKKSYLLVNLQTAKHIPKIIQIKMQQNMNIAHACTCESQLRYACPWPVEYCLVNMYLATTVGRNCNSQRNENNKNVKTYLS